MNVKNAPQSSGMRLMTSKGSHRRRRHPPQRVTALGSQQFRALLALLVFLVVCILVEMLLVDTVFLGPSGHIVDTSLTNRGGVFFSDTGALEHGGGHLNKPKSPQQHNNDPSDAAFENAHQNLQAQYGREARFVGLDTCRRYRGKLEEGDGAAMAVLGLFQRRTPFFVQLMRKNCKLPDEQETDIIYNSEIEEHFPLRKFSSTVLPVVIVQDPLPWMTDVCRDRPKELEIDSVARKDCPSLDEPVRVRYLEFKNATTHASLAHLWNDWYEPWLTHHSGPRLLVRAEDVLLHPQDVVTEVCQCIGGSIHDYFRNKAPWHIDAVPDRMEAYNEDTLQYAMDHLDPQLMNVLGYSFT